MCGLKQPPNLKQDQNVRQVVEDTSMQEDRGHQPPALAPVEDRIVLLGTHSKQDLVGRSDHHISLEARGTEQGLSKFEAVVAVLGLIVGIAVKSIDVKFGNQNHETCNGDQWDRDHNATSSCGGFALPPPAPAAAGAGAFVGLCFSIFHGQSIVVVAARGGVRGGALRGTLRGVRWRLQQRARGGLGWELCNPVRHSLAAVEWTNHEFDCWKME
mmetsp:Transcript_73891/g.161710  ORF Transcript_73891/g.161710 Transcript_73891/m.161710 type:complete len:214 (+) Transcript_73891:919-1560(+)